MKQSPILLLLFLLILFGSCRDNTTSTISENSTKSEKAENNCRNEVDETRVNLEEENIDLYFNIKQQDKFQNLHLDLKNSFGILGKLKIDTNTSIVQKFEVRLKEVGKCERYTISNAVYNSPPRMSNGKLFHDIIIFIKDRQDDEPSNNTVLVNNLSALKLGENEYLDIHFNSTSPDIPTKVDEDGKLLIGDPLVDFGDRWCKSKIISI